MSIVSQRLNKSALGRSLLRQSLRGLLLGLVLVPTLIVWVGVSSALFSYQAIGGHGTSMEPAVRDGDALWVKHLDASEVKVGDIVTLQLAAEESITHRVVRIEPLSQGGFLFQTRGDANQWSEWWEVAAEEKIVVAFIRVPFAGYVLDFCASIIGRTLLIGVVATTAVIWVRRRQALRRNASKESKEV